MLKMIIVLAGLLVFTSSCKEKEASVPLLSEKMQLLTQGVWVKVGFELNGKDVWEVFPACTKDDLYTYQSSGNATVDQHLLACDTNYPKIVGWQWEFLANETQIREHTNDTTSYLREIIKLNSSEFQYETWLNGSVTVSSFERK